METVSSVVVVGSCDGSNTMKKKDSTSQCMIDNMFDEEFVLLLLPGTVLYPGSVGKK